MRRGKSTNLSVSPSSTLNKSLFLCIAHSSFFSGFSPLSLWRQSSSLYSLFNLRSLLLSNSLTQYFLPRLYLWFDANMLDVCDVIVDVEMDKTTAPQKRSQSVSIGSWWLAVLYKTHLLHVSGWENDIFFSMMVSVISGGSWVLICPVNLISIIWSYKNGMKRHDWQLRLTGDRSSASVDGTLWSQLHPSDRLVKYWLKNYLVSPPDAECVTLFTKV